MYAWWNRMKHHLSSLVYDFGEESWLIVQNSIPDDSQSAWKHRSAQVRVLTIKYIFSPVAKMSIKYDYKICYFSPVSKITIKYDYKIWYFRIRFGSVQSPFSLVLPTPFSIEVDGNNSNSYCCCKCNPLSPRFSDELKQGWEVSLQYLVAVLQQMGGG